MNKAKKSFLTKVLSNLLKQFVDLKLIHWTQWFSSLMQFSCELDQLRVEFLLPNVLTWIFHYLCFELKFQLVWWHYAQNFTQTRPHKSPLTLMYSFSCIFCHIYSLLFIKSSFEYIFRPNAMGITLKSRAFFSYLHSFSRFLFLMLKSKSFQEFTRSRK